MKFERRRRLPFRSFRTMYVRVHVCTCRRVSTGRETRVGGKGKEGRQRERRNRSHFLSFFRVTVTKVHFGVAVPPQSAVALPPHLASAVESIYGWFFPACAATSTSRRPPHARAHYRVSHTSLRDRLCA